MKKNSFKPISTGIGMAAMLTSASCAFAIQHDLVNNGSQSVSGYLGQVAIFDKASLRSSGTGGIQPFLRVHDSDTFEQGFNTSNPGGGNPDGFNAIDGAWTQDLLLSSLQATTHNGSGSYYQFLLDLGEPGNSATGNAVTELLLLQKFNLYTGNTASPTFAGIGGNPDNLGTKRWDLGGNTIMFVDENSGNGQADVLIFVPTAAFDGVTDTYLYLYAEMGNEHSGLPEDGDAEGSFEEFAALTREPTDVPDGGSTIALLGLAMAGFGFVRGKVLKA